MSFWRGLQSAVFYYLNCTPCADARHRKKRKLEAQRDKAQQDMLHAQIPNLYRHPEPSATNPFWEAEIALGPTLTRGKRKPATGDSQRALKTSATQSSNGSTIPSSLDLPRAGSRDSRHDSKTNGFGPVQREDEILWGSSATEPPLRSHLDGSSGNYMPSKPLRARTTDSRVYVSQRNPAVNDFHPATVTKVNSRKDVAWMLQPPPIAEIMSGKEQPSQSGSESESGSSRFSRGSVTDTSLPRQVSERLLRRNLTREMSRESSSRQSGGHAGQHRDGHTTSTMTEERDFATAESSSKRAKRRPSPIHVSTDSEDSAVTIVHGPSVVPEPVQRKERSHKVASRPQLSTIASDSIIPIADQSDFYTPLETPRRNNHPPSARQSEDDTGHSRDRLTRRSAILVHDNNVQVLEDLTPKSTIFNTKIFNARGGELKKATSIRLPSPEDGDGDEAQTMDGAGPEMFNSWYTPDFELDKWVHEHTKRAVTRRWSMDL